jgi:hypothetical protein
MGGTELVKSLEALIIRRAAFLFGFFSTAALIAPTMAQEQARRTIYVKHLEPPRLYPALARQTRVQGTIVIKLVIDADGTVLSTESSRGDASTTGFDILKGDAEKIVKTCTFGCVGCASNAPFEHTIRFKYQLDYQDTLPNNRVVLNLPDEMTISTSPEVVYPCADAKTSKKKGSH